MVSLISWGSAEPRVHGRSPRDQPFVANAVLRSWCTLMVTYGLMSHRRDVTLFNPRMGYIWLRLLHRRVRALV